MPRRAGARRSPLASRRRCRGDETLEPLTGCVDHAERGVLAPGQPPQPRRASAGATSSESSEVSATLALEQRPQAALFGPVGHQRILERVPAAETHRPASSVRCGCGAARARLSDSGRTRGHDPARSGTRSTSSSRTAARSACARPRPRTRRPSSRSSPASPSEPLPPLPRARPVERKLVEPFLDPDWIERGALVGTLRRGPESVVALASYARLRDPERPRSRSRSPTRSRAAASARGCSSSSPCAAAASGSRASSPRCCATNRAMLGVFADAGFEVDARARQRRGRAAASRSRATEASSRASTSATTSAVVASLRPFFAPASVAVIGASRRRGSIGGELFRNMLDADFAGAVYPVNRQRRAGRGRPRLPVGRGDPRSGRPGRDLRPGAHVLDAADPALAGGRPRALRDLGGLRRDGRRGAGAAGAAARARAGARRAAGRPELPRHRRSAPAR